jgi:hypothetical protein
VSGVIFLIVAAETPAFDKSLTEEYGRPAMIFFAVASPTPGKSFSSAALAVFKSTGAPLPPDALDALAFSEPAALLELALLELALAGAGAAAPPVVTNGVIFLIVAAETPAFDKSLVEEYGRPAMIFLAVAAPTPGKLSKSFSLALFRSIFASPCGLGGDPASVRSPKPNTAMMKSVPTIL